jgi:hypothetical protein
LEEVSFAMNESLNRRNFLKAVGLSGAGAITAPVYSAWAEETIATKKWRMRLSTSSIHFMELPIEHVKYEPKRELELRNKGE